jgi:hypothetical protein
MNGRTILIGLLVLALLAGAAGVGVYAYNAGVAQGLVQSGKVTVVEGGPGPYPYYGGPFLFRPWGFGFGFLGCLLPLLFFFLIFGLLRGLFWRGPWGWRRGWGAGHHGHGPWGEGSVPPMFEEWHRRAHGQGQSTPPESQPAEK